MQLASPEELLATSGFLRRPFGQALGVVKELTESALAGGIDLTAELHGGNPALSRASIRPLWAKFSTGNRSRLALEFHCVGDCTLFALRKTARLQQAVN